MVKLRNSRFIINASYQLLVYQVTNNIQMMRFSFNKRQQLGVRKYQYQYFIY